MILITLKWFLESVSLQKLKYQLIKNLGVANIKNWDFRYPPMKIEFFGVSGDQMQQLGEGNRLSEFCSSFFHSFARMQWIKMLIKYYSSSFVTDNEDIM